MTHSTRRDFLAVLSMLPLAAYAAPAFAQQKLPVRRMPGSGEALPVIGLGSSKVVDEIAKNGDDPLRQVLRTLVSHGGKVIEPGRAIPPTTPGSAASATRPEFLYRLFVTTKIDRAGKDAGIAQLRQAQQLYGRKVLDLAQIFSLTDVDTHWPTLREWKESGRARYIGVTVSEPRRHADLESFLKRERPDTIQVNYSITERESEDRLIPLAADRGVAVIINRPFMNGAYSSDSKDARCRHGPPSSGPHVGGVLAEVHPRESACHRRAHRNEQPEAHGRKRAGGHRSAARRVGTEADARVHHDGVR